MSDFNLMEFLTKKKEEGAKLSLEGIKSDLAQLEELKIKVVGPNLIKWLTAMCGLGMEINGKALKDINEELTKNKIDNDDEYAAGYEKAFNEKGFVLSYNPAIQKAFNAAKAATEGPTAEDKVIDAMLTKSAVVSKASRFIRLADQLTSLYGSNFTGMPHDGLLMPNTDSTVPPLWQYKPSKGEAVEKPRKIDDTGTESDIIICNILSASNAELSVHYEVDHTTGFPSYSDFMKGSSYLLEAQLMFQTGNIRYSGHTASKNSITHWNTLTKAGIDTNKARIQSPKDLRKWIEWVLKRQFCRYVIDSIGMDKIKEYLANEEFNWRLIDATLESVASTLNKSVKNVIAVVERKPSDDGERMETTKIATLVTGLNVEGIAAQLVADGNLNKDGSKLVKAKGHYDNSTEISTIQIAYNGVFAENKIYAGDIVDKLANAGIKTSWSHMLLGRDTNNDMVYHDDFKVGDASNYFYTIYGGSGSGKGNMTLSLLAGAMCDGCKIFYIDGKPDSGLSVGQEAWMNGKEAFVFDGQPRALCEPFDELNYQAEEIPNIRNVRSIEEKEAGLELLPDELFSGNESTRRLHTLRLLGVTRYLRGIEFWVKTLTSIPSDQWAVYVFDEIASMNENELKVRQMMYDRAAALLQAEGIKASTIIDVKEGTYTGVTYNALQGFKTAGLKPKDLETIKQAFDKHPALRYIDKWTKWSNQLRSEVGNIIVIAGRQSHQTTFIIFQKATWFRGSAAGKTSATTIHAFAKSIGDISRKFVGKEALENECGCYGNAPAVKSSWYNDHCMKGKWALTKTARVDADESNILRFNPFSCWGYVKDPENTVCDESTKHQTRYFHYYLTKLLSIDGISAADELQKSYDFANSFISSNSDRFDLLDNGADAVKKFMYNCINFDSVSGIEELGAVGAEDSEQSGGGNVEPNFDYLDKDAANTGSFAATSTATESDYTEEDFRNDGVGTETKDELSGHPFADAGTNDYEGNAADEEAKADERTYEAEEEAFYNEGTYGGAAETPLARKNDVPDDAEIINTGEHESNTAVTRASRETSVSGTGKDVQIDLSKAERATPAARLNTDNSIRCTEGYIDEKTMMRIMNSPKKYDKFCDYEAECIIDSIIRSSRGRLSVRIIELHTNRMIVDKKLIVNNMLEYMGTDPYPELIDFVTIFERFPNLNVLLLDQEMFNVFETQIEPLITDVDYSDGIENAAYYALKSLSKLNTIQVIGLQTYKKADLLKKERLESMRLRKERAARKYERSLSDVFAGMRATKRLGNPPKRMNSEAKRRKVFNGLKKRKSGGGIRGFFGRRIAKWWNKINAGV